MYPSDLLGNYYLAPIDRFLAAPEELRAVATAETVDWLFPEFETDEPQQDAVHALLRACSDARSAVFRHSHDFGRLV
jgi:hypothetical protein